MANQTRDAFCEDSRVKTPTIMHLMAMGFKYVSLKGLKNSAGQRVDVKIDEESHRLESEILRQLDSINFNDNANKE